jgi:hypothetical protein
MARLSADARRKRRRREAARAAGRCIRCNKYPADGHPLCKRCHEIQYQEIIAKRTSWRIAGRCLRCGGKRDGPQALCASCRTYNANYNKRHRARLRQAILARYGNACRCCHEREWRFLTLDHVFNDGGVERNIYRSSNQLYAKLLKRRTLSRRHQLLCWNCNLAKYHFGICPHKAGRRRGA